MRSTARQLFLSGILSFGMLMGATEAFSQSLLPGATASNYNPPAGWSVIHTQGCEGGIDANREFLPSQLCTTTRPHGGAKSIQGTHASDGGGVRWLGYGPALGITGSEVYVSWWEYLDANGRMNDEMFIFQMIKRGLPPGPLNVPFQELVVDWYYDTAGTYNSSNGRIVTSTQGGYKDFPFWSGEQAVPWGVWTQWEAHVKANTPGLTDGSIRVYKNGVLNYQVTGDLVGQANMSGPDIQVGGVYTRHVWRHTNGTCGAFIGDGQAIAIAGQPDSNYRCVDFNNCSCPPNNPIFNRYLDDIIVMIPGSGGGSPVGDNPPGPPLPPSGLKFQ